MILRLAETSAKKGKNNVAFLAYFLLGRYNVDIYTMYYASTACHRHEVKSLTTIIVYEWFDIG